MTVLWEFKKNREKPRTIYPKNHESFKNSKPRVQFYWFLYKKKFSALCQNKFLLISLIEHSDISLSHSITHQSH